MSEEFEFFATPDEMAYQIAAAIGVARDPGKRISWPGFSPSHKQAILDQGIEEGSREWSRLEKLSEAHYSRIQAKGDHDGYDYIGTMRYGDEGTPINVSASISIDLSAIFLEIDGSSDLRVAQVGEGLPKAVVMLQEHEIDILIGMLQAAKGHIARKVESLRFAQSSQGSGRPR